MVMTTTFGFVQMYLPLGFYTNFRRDGKPPNFWRNMVIVGTMRSVQNFEDDVSPPTTFSVGRHCALCFDCCLSQRISLLLLDHLFVCDET